MDCEKFEATLIDELYDELDELTSAAAKRHVAGCARCAALIGGLRATRRIAVLPMVSPSADLEDRILAAAKDAQKVVPLERRLSRAISWAGSWAMRPQTAMAALFLLMIGASSLLLRGTNRAPSTANMTITAEGSPAASVAPVPAEAVAKVDPTAAAAAHGVLAPPAAAVPAATAAASAVAAAGPAPASPPADLAKDKDDSLADEVAQNGKNTQNGWRGKSAAYGAVGGGGSAGGGDSLANADTPSGGAPAQHYAPAKPTARTSMAPGEPYASAERALEKKEGAVQAQGSTTSPPSALESAIALYRAGNFGQATPALDALAASEPEAALYAARSVRDGGGGCAAAIPRFDSLASRSFGTRVGYDAVFEGGQCLRQVGSTEMARSHFGRLLTVPAYAPRAQAAIESLSQGQVASRKAAMPAPAPKKNAPAATTVMDQAAPPQAAPTQQAPQQAPSQQAPARKPAAF